MAIKDGLIAELQMEAASTRKMLERVPADKNDWKPHDKSMKMGNLAVHVAELPSWIGFTMNADELDLSTMNYKPTIPDNNADLLAKLDNTVKEAVEVLGKSDDAEFQKMWTLRNGSHVIFTMPKIAVLRSMVYSHHYHHRGQLSVYLRLLDIPVPGMYGPSADDMAAMAAAQATAAAN
ncbi:MAG: hypothetical protein JWQ38_1026 [Flavipsychrobacter sp.]|nr:hypothetical protein [Flavipsychrobacter sp.]